MAVGLEKEQDTMSTAHAHVDAMARNVLFSVSRYLSDTDLEGYNTP